MKYQNEALTITGISKAYRKRQVLRDVNLTVRPGECIGIIGSNGCGKTTLLSILAGVLKADSGQMYLHPAEGCWDGDACEKADESAGDQADCGKWAEITGDARGFSRMVAYVPQENPLIGELSVRDNLLLWYGGDRKAMERDLAVGAAAMLGVNQMLERTVDHLSGGMKKRLSIACALSRHASILILDEPGAALDMECKADIRRYLKEYRAAGGAVVLTSHELTELSVCTSLYVLTGGSLKAVETELSEEALTRYF